MDVRLDGEVAAVSGAARGLGAPIAWALAREGVTVFLGEVLEGAGQEMASEIAADGGRATFMRLDVTRQEGWAGNIGRAVHDAGRLDVLVNNAGIYRSPASSTRCSTCGNR